MQEHVFEYKFINVFVTLPYHTEFINLKMIHVCLRGLRGMKCFCNDQLTSDYRRSFTWLNSTGVKQCTFHWLISSELIKKQRVFNSLIIYQLFMITCIRYENIFAISVPKCIKIAPLWTRVICITDSDGIYNTDYTCLKWSNINQFW